ncbi:hypothetical protein [Nocardia callitridis]|uniref:Uncharacterized protein n=1 Tax=Nocardia callitridis TaxID=648753 RepID=A0ABP9KK42_9NOCA
MAVVHPSVTDSSGVRGSSRAHSIAIAGSAWPMFKLEALVAGIVVCAVLGLVTGSAQAAVLVGATVAMVRWVLGRARARVGTAPSAREVRSAAH